MKTPTDPARKRQKIKLRILDNAVREFAKNGLKGGSVKIIAEGAGLSKAQLYYYISSKEELYEQTLIHIIHIWQDLFAIENAEHGPEAFLRGYIKRKMRMSLEHPEISQLYSNEIAQGAPFLKKHWHMSKSQFDLGTTKINQWVKQGLMRPVDPQLLQLNIWGVTQNYALHAAQVRYLTGIDEDARFDFEHLMEEATDLILYGCGIKPAGKTVGSS